MPFKCPKCHSEMKEIYENNKHYWLCEKCGYVVRERKRRKKQSEEKPKDWKKQLKEYFKKNYDIDLGEEFDWDRLDSSLSIDELISQAEEQLRVFYPDKFYVDKDEIEAYEREATRREEEYYKKEWEKRIEYLKNNNIKDLSKYYEDYYKHIEAFLNNKKVNGMVVVGKAGIGKSFNLILKLKQMNKDFVLVKGHNTPLSFYRTLYENRKGQILVLDDITELIKNQTIVSLLLGALDYDNKIVKWSSESPLTSDLPKEFIFDSKIFVLANEFDAKSEFAKAVKDRCIMYELEFSREQLIEMMYIIAKAKNYPLELVDYIKELSESEAIENLSLRLLDKLYPYHKYDNWKNLVKEIIEIDETKSIVLELMKSSKSVSEQVKEFIEKTGLSRATYFRIKAQLKSQNLKSGGV